MIAIINATMKRRGNIVIPSFAVERAQDIIYELNQYYTEYIQTEDRDFLNVPVYVDSPLTFSATEIFLRNPDCFDEDALKLISIGNNPLDFRNLRFTRTTEESKQINFSKESKVIISASGMCTAGRIKHHLKHNLWRKESSIVFVGYQAEGTLGRRIKEGEKVVKIFGEEIRVNAEIYSLDGFSGHADREGIMQWIKAFKNKPKKIFVVHGEEEAAGEISKRIEEELKIKTYTPELGERLSIEEEKVLPGERLEIRGKSVESRGIEENIEKLKSIFWPVLKRLELKADQSANSEELNSYKNKLIDIQKDILDLNMLITEENKEENNKN